MVSDAAQTLEPVPAPRDKPRDFDAFLSYTHGDRPVVSGIQKGLHHIGRRLGQLRALRVFRDDTDLTASPDLWGRITDALDRSRFFIATLSPQAAASHWVNKEISYWLEHRGLEQLMLVVAAGTLDWDETTARFDPQNSDAAPPALTEPGSLPAEPLFIDVSADAPWDYHTPTFRDKITSLAAPIHGKPKDQLASDDLREQRRFRRLRAAAITGLIVLTVLAVVAAAIAVVQRQQAIARLHDAVVAKLNAEGTAMLAGTTPGGDVRALQELLAANAIEANGFPILDAQIARFTTRKIVGIPATPRHLAYSPDGRRIATTEDDGIVRQWDATTGKPIGSPIKAHTGLVNAVAYTPDGQTIASAGADGTMRLSNAQTGTPLNPNPTPAGVLISLAVSPGGKTIVTAGADGIVRIWDAHTGQPRGTLQAFTGSTIGLTDVKFDPNGKLFAVSNDNGAIAIFETNPFKPHIPVIVVRGYDSQQEIVDRIAFSPDGHTIAAGSVNLQLWNTDTGTLVRTIQLGTSRVAGAIAVAFSPDGRRIATGRADGALQLWDADTGAQLGSTLTGHTNVLFDVAFSRDGNQIASISPDGTLRLWNANLGQPMRGPDPVLAEVAFSPDGHRVAAAGDTAVEQWDLGAGQSLPPLTGPGAGVRSFGYVDGGRIVLVAADGTAQIWDAGTGQPAGPPVRLDIGPGRSRFAFSGDGRTIAAEGEDGTITVWEAESGEPRGQPLKVPTPTSSGVGEPLAFSPDGHRIAAGYTDGLRVWNADSTQSDQPVLMTRPGPQNSVLGVAFSHDGAAVAAAYTDGTVELWDPGTRKQLPNSPFRGHTSGVISVAIGPSHQLVSGGVDATMRLWNTTTGQPTASPITRSDTVTSVALSPDGRLAASASLDGAVLVSPAIADTSQLCDKLSANMSHKQWRDWVSPGIGYIAVCPGLPVPPD